MQTRNVDCVVKIEMTMLSGLRQSELYPESGYDRWRAFRDTLVRQQQQRLTTLV